MGAPQSLGQLDAVHSGHADVHNRAGGIAGTCIVLQEFQELIAGRQRDALVASRVQQSTERDANRFIVIDYEDLCC